MKENKQNSDRVARSSSKTKTVSLASIRKPVQIDPEILKIKKNIAGAASRSVTTVSSAPSKNQAQIDPEILAIKKNIATTASSATVRNPTKIDTEILAAGAISHRSKNASSALYSGILKTKNPNKSRTTALVKKSTTHLDSSMSTASKMNVSHCRKRIKKSRSSESAGAGEGEGLEDEEKAPPTEAEKMQEQYGEPAESESTVDGGPPMLADDVAVNLPDVVEETESSRDEEHVSPCICHLPEKVLHDIEVKEAKQKLRQKQFQGRLDFRRAEVKKRKEEAEAAEEQTDPDAFTDVIIATPEGMVRKRARRKGPKKSKKPPVVIIKKRIGKKWINWKKPPKIPVTWTKTAMLRKGKGVYCKPKIEEELGYCVDWKKPPAACWKPTRAFELREKLSKLRRKKLEEAECERRRKPRFILSLKDY